jgi:hypothetical protein
MNRYTDHYRNAWLAVAVIAMTGTLALAGDLPTVDQSPASTTIVVAAISSPANIASKPRTLQHDQDRAVTEAIENVMADNKLQLDLRLSGHKSVILAAD